jgi:hypothetical protein
MCFFGEVTRLIQFPMQYCTVYLFFSQFILELVQTEYTLHSEMS